ncbi:hypothetical protein SAMN05444372_10840 [Flavobacterium micromati]|uniref:Uncharacterized protein n=1 Tax=Flavobacterium micromati TaxID=229205 RepID=A0A1M5LEC1_9FLAO|nr:hypothetical protein [Flavobacterium micromati]SHG63377.1 hypothetical protein SAMN05444372_10840 [Flavobacterium micromati]
MKFFLKSVVAVALILSLNSCSKDDDESTDSKTNAKITVTDANGPVSGMVVYVYDQSTWGVIGDEPNFANGQVSTDKQGIATFSNLEYTNIFNEINNNQNNMRFSAHYSLKGVKKTKVITITFNKGESKTGALLLN